MGDSVVNYTPWLDSLRSALSGADDSAIQLSLGNAVREFCTQSGAFIDELGPTSFTTSTTYNIRTQTSGDVMWVHSVIDADTRLPYPLLLAGQRYTHNLTTPAVYVHSPGLLEFTSLPDTSGFYTTASLIPRKLDVPEDVKLPDEFASAYFEAIYDGTMGRMMSQHKKPWSNAVLAQYHLRRFRNGMNQARDVTRRRFANAEDKTVFPPW